MKKLMFAIAMTVSASAFAQEMQFPDFGLMTQGQKNAVKADAGVNKYSKSMGASSFKVVAKSTVNDPITYTVKTNNGCSFDVVVVYADNFWDGIENVVVKKATTVCN